MSAKFIVSHLEEQLGPFDENELRNKLASGDVFAIDYIYDDVKQDWVLLSERFPWATSKNDGTSPPPLREVSLKKKRPPEPPSAAHDEAVTQTSVPIPVLAEPPPPESEKSVAAPAPLAAPLAAPLPAPLPVAVPVPVAVWPETKVKMVDGFGEVDLALPTPGDLELSVLDPSTDSIKAHSPLKIHVKAPEPTKVVWTVAPHQTVGQDLEIRLQVLDASAHLCTHFEDQFLVRTEGPFAQEIGAHVKQGEALVKVQNTTAGLWKVMLQTTGGRILQLPETHTVEWLPGPAARLIVDGPQEYVAGYPLKVQVKAVDAFGNLAKTYQGTVTLEIKAS